MQDEHIKEFGLPSEFHEHTRARSEVAEAKALHAVTQDNWDLQLLEIAEMELEALKPTGKPISNFRTKNRVAIALDIKNINPRQIATIDYFHLVEEALETSRDARAV